jgi:hypothetical protein
MTNILNKLWASKSTIVILLWVAVLACAYNLDYINIKKSKIELKPAGRTVEEIMATPVNKTIELNWDREFKSSIEEIK